jgi:endoglucanase
LISPGTPAGFVPADLFTTASMKNKRITLFACSLIITASLVAANVPISRIKYLLHWGNNDTRPHQVNGKFSIPIDPNRWYQLNNTSSGLQGLFDGLTDKPVETGFGKVLHWFDAYYPLEEGEEMTIESILFYDGEGRNMQEPFTLSIITDKWQRVQIAAYTGDKYKSWVGPDGGLEDFTLPAPARNPRYLVISTASFYPAEMVFYGTYKAGKALAKPSFAALAKQKQVKFKQTTGINAFEWDFEEAGNPGVIDEVKWRAIRNFSGIRHYMDWEKLERQEGQYTFNPVHAGGWNYDAIYERCRAEGREVLACLKTLPPWMRGTYPVDQQDSENVPVKYARDFADPASYREQARVGFQFAARYGRNKQVDPALVRVNESRRWTGDKPNEVKIGLGLVRYIENENERDKWWKGRKAYQTGREYAANLSAFYDGHKNSLGPAVGVKNADPAMQVVMGGLAHPSTDYIRGMIDWCKEFRGYKADGSVDLCWDVINYHLYANDAHSSQGGEPRRGGAPELSEAGKVAREFVAFAHQYARGMPVWITETGYDLHPGSPQKAIPIHNKPADQTQADWILRSSLLYARYGVERVFFYQLVDDNAGNGGRFATSGLVNQDRSRRPAADYLYQVNALLGEYAYQETISQDPIVDRYAHEGKSIYVLVVADEKGRTADYVLNLGEAAAAFVYTPAAGQAGMGKKQLKTVKGKVRIRVTETPVFVSGADVAL